MERHHNDRTAQRLAQQVVDPTNWPTPQAGASPHRPTGGGGGKTHLISLRSISAPRLAAAPELRAGRRVDSSMEFLDHV